MVEDSMDLLEAIGTYFYPGLYVLINEAVGDVLGKQDLTASIIACRTPDLGPTSIVAIAMVQPGPIGRHALPPDWRDVLECSCGKSWDVDLYVPRSDVVTIRRLARQVNSRAAVIPLPTGTVRSPFRRPGLSAGEV